MTPERKAELRAIADNWSIDTGYVRNALSEALDAIDEHGAAWDRAREILSPSGVNTANVLAAIDDAVKKLLAAEKRVAEMERALHKINDSICGPYGVACQCTVTARDALGVKP
jgi:hypothetical protein